jgi:multidrug transporter EmrE-like cation transporter
LAYYIFIGEESLMIWALISISLNAVAQLLMKRISSGDLNFLSLAREPQTYFVLAIYSSSVMTWLLALRNLNLSIAYPLQSLGYVLVSLLSFYFLGEKFSISHVLALFLIVTGSLVLVIGT